MTQIKPTWDEVRRGRCRRTCRPSARSCATQLHEIEATAPDPLAHAYAYVNTGEAAPQSYVLRMGDPHNRLDPVEPAVPYVLRAGYKSPDGRPPDAAPPSPTGWRRATIR